LRSLVVRSTLLAAVGTGALVATGSLGSEEQARLALYTYVLFLGLLGGRILLALTTSALPSSGSALEAATHRRPSPGTDVGEAKKVRDLLLFAEQREFEFYYRLRPLLREVAAARLARRRGLDLDRDAAAKSILGSEVWELLRLDREPPEDRLAPGPKLDVLEGMIAAIERI
jgi:hypothetical protein